MVIHIFSYAFCTNITAHVLVASLLRHNKMDLLLSEDVMYVNLTTQVEDDRYTCLIKPDGQVLLALTVSFCISSR